MPYRDRYEDYEDYDRHNYKKKKHEREQEMNYANFSPTAAGYMGGGYGGYGGGMGFGGGEGIWALLLLALLGGRGGFGFGGGGCNDGCCKDGVGLEILQNGQETIKSIMNDDKNTQLLMSAIKDCNCDGKAMQTLLYSISEKLGCSTKDIEHCICEVSHKICDVSKDLALTKGDIINKIQEKGAYIVDAIKDSKYDIVTMLNKCCCEIDHHLDKMENHFDREICEVKQVVKAGDNAILLDNERNTNKIMNRIDKLECKLESDAKDARIKDLEYRLHCSDRREDKNKENETIIYQNGLVNGIVDAMKKTSTEVG